MAILSVKGLSAEITSKPLHERFGVSRIWPYVDEERFREIGPNDATPMEPMS